MGLWEGAKSLGRNFKGQIKSNMAIKRGASTKAAAKRAIQKKPAVDAKTMNKIKGMESGGLDQFKDYTDVFEGMGASSDEATTAVRDILKADKIDDVKLGFSSDVDFEAFKTSGVFDEIRGVGGNKLDIDGESISLKEAMLGRRNSVSDAEKKALNSVISDDYYGDKVADANKLKGEEYKKRVNKNRESGVEFSKQDLMEELNEDARFKVDNPYEDGRKIHDENMNGFKDTKKDAMADMNKQKLSDKEKVAASKKINDDFDASVKGEKSRYGAQGDDIFKEHGFREGTRQDAFAEALGGGAGGQAESVLGRGSSYFWQDADNTQRAMRIGGAAAGVVGVGVAGRYLSGGNMSYNADGEKDIAGIPFI